MTLIKKINFDVFGDERGSLISLETHKNIPFDIKRIYYIFNTKTGVSRGFHAHRNLKQVVICLSGSCDFTLDDGKTRESITLDKPNEAIYIENYQWREMHNFSSDCVLIVIASEHYSEDDYIRDYDLFLKEIKNGTLFS